MKIANQPLGATSLPERVDSLPGTAAKPREWSRLECQNYDIQVPIQKRDSEPRESHLLDKSFGGIGVRVAQADWFEVGDEVTVMFYSAPVRAVVRMKRQIAEDAWRLGLEWKDGMFE